VTAPNQSDGPSFVTLLADDSAYRELADWALTREERWAVLMALNDLNQARLQETIPQDQISKVIRTDAFTLGVMRSSSAYRAFNKGPRYINRNVLPWIDDARADFSTVASLRGFDEPHQVSIRFGSTASLVSDRVHVLIGKNGTGKSQLLRQIVGSLALQADDDDSAVFLDTPNALFDPSAVKSLPIPNAVLVFAADVDSPFPRRARLDTALDYSYFGLSTSADGGSASNSLEQHSLGSVLRDLLRDDTTLKDRTRFQLFRDVVRPVIPLTLLHLPIRSGTKNVSGIVTDASGHSWLPFEHVPSSEQQTLYLAAALDTDRDLGLLDGSGQEFPPSSGQRVYLRFAAQALGVIAQGSLLVLDEPETHLHPNFVSEFMTLLHQILEATNSIALVATHSPYVVRETPTACVHVVHRKGNAPSITGVHLKTLGASVSSISDAVFGDPSAKRFHRIIAKQLALKASEAATTDAQRVAWLIETYGQELNTEMLSTVRYLLTYKPQAPDETEGDDVESD
jgi:ABC-type transport system involved in cytochrome c biogenesis ATPase subunit